MTVREYPFLQKWEHLEGGKTWGEKVKSLDLGWVGMGFHTLGGTQGQELWWEFHCYEGTVGSLWPDEIATGKSFETESEEVQESGESRVLCNTEI